MCCCCHAGFGTCWRTFKSTLIISRPHFYVNPTLPLLRCSFLSSQGDPLPPAAAAWQGKPPARTPSSRPLSIHTHTRTQRPSLVACNFLDDLGIRNNITAINAWGEKMTVCHTGRVTGGRETVDLSGCVSLRHWRSLANTHISSCPCKGGLQQEGTQLSRRVGYASSIGGVVINLPAAKRQMAEYQSFRNGRSFPGKLQGEALSLPSEAEAPVLSSWVLICLVQTVGIEGKKEVERPGLIAGRMGKC